MLFKEAGIIEKYGSGIKRVLDATRSSGLKEPLFEEILGGFRVTLYKITQKTTTKERIIDLLQKIRV